MLRLIGEGNANKQIAHQLGISTRTVEIHRARIIQKTGIHSTAKLTLHAIELGLIAPPEDNRHAQL